MLVEFRLSLSLAMNRFASSRSRTSSFDSDDGFKILKNWFVSKGTKAPEVALANMAMWGAFHSKRQGFHGVLVVGDAVRSALTFAVVESHRYERHVREVARGENHRT